MWDKAEAFIRDEGGAMGTQIGLGVALGLELIFVIVDWMSRV